MTGPLARVRFWRDHRWTPAQLSAYLDGDRVQRSRRRIERHVHDCPECRAALQSLERLLGRLHRIGPVAPEPTPEILAAVQARLRE